MNYKILLATFLIFSCSPPIAQAQDCTRGNPQRPTYQLRDNYLRCEGIRPINVSGSFSLLSFSTGRLNNSRLSSLDIPNIGIPEQQLKVKIKSLHENYQLVPLDFQPRHPLFHFEWSNDVLERAGISLDSLSFLASFRSGFGRIYVPVILGQPLGKYDIVFYSNRHVEITRFQILQNDRVIYNHSDSDLHSPGKIFLTWDGSAPSGRYQLLVNARLIPSRGSPQPVFLNITFEHDPKWLK
ncbi:MAG: hypothetical protein AB4290_04710 [Spirulina sp.]